MANNEGQFRVRLMGHTRFIRLNLEAIAQMVKRDLEYLDWYEEGNTGTFGLSDYEDMSLRTRERVAEMNEIQRALNHFEKLQN